MGQDDVVPVAADRLAYQVAFVDQEGEDLTECPKGNMDGGRREPLVLGGLYPGVDILGGRLGQILCDDNSAWGWECMTKGLEGSDNAFQRQRRILACL